MILISATVTTCISASAKALLTAKSSKKLRRALDQLMTLKSKQVALASAANVFFAPASWCKTPCMGKKVATALAYWLPVAENTNEFDSFYLTKTMT
jgi:hypothetical protein